MARLEVSRQQWEQLAVEANFDANTLARLCRLSVRQLQREFHRRHGRPPRDWLNEQRIMASRRLLLEGMPIKVVAYELGFKQPSHFCRMFREQTHMRPSEFARSQIENLKDHVACR